MTPDQKLEAAVQRAGGEVKDLSALAAAAKAELASRPKARPWWVDAAVVLALNLAMGVAGAALLQWNDQQHHSVTTKYLVAVLWFVFMSVASVLWLRPGAAGPRWAALGAFGVVSAVMLLGLSGFDPGGAFLDGLWCAFAECKLAVVPVALAVALSKRFAARTSHMLLGALAASAGGATALHFHCPNGTFAHVGLFHVLPAVVLGAAAALARRLWPKSYVP
jgi:hypothetical protein